MLKQKLQHDQIEALKSGDKDRLNALRYLNSKIKNKEIEKNSELSEEEVIAVVRKQVKELNETIASAKTADRPTLINESEKELQIISAYLPQEISDDELKKEVEKFLAANQELYQKNPKAIIGLAIKELKDKAEPTRIVKALQAIQK